DGGFSVHDGTPDLSLAVFNVCGSHGRPQDMVLCTACGADDFRFCADSLGGQSLSVLPGEISGRAVAEKCRGSGGSNPGTCFRADGFGLARGCGLDLRVCGS